MSNPTPMPQGQTAVSLEREASGVKVSIEDFLPSFAKKLSSLFLYSNWSILALVCIIFCSDIVMIFFDKIKPSDRIIDKQVMLALIGATVIQTGSIIAAIVTSLLKRKQDPS